jgi:aldehyde dehydrogenase (NAD+)
LAQTVNGFLQWSDDMIQPDDISRQFIGGEWMRGHDDTTVTDINPYTGETLTTFSGASADQVDQAFRAADRAQDKWWQKLPQERAQILRRAADTLRDMREDVVDLIVAETGSTVAKAQTEVDIALGIMDEAASFPMRMSGSIMPSTTPGKESRVYREPLGVVSVISPWNFPLNLSMRSVVTALATGNGVVLKPAGDTPMVGGTVIAHIFEGAGLPNGLLNVIVGDTDEIGDPMVTHDIAELVSFTGSTPVGRRIGRLAGEHIKEVALELGGNNPFVVLDDADLDQAASAAAMGRFLHSGQICISVNRILVDESIHDAFLEKFLEKVKSIRTGDPSKRETLVGPLTNDEQANSVRAHIERMKETDAELVLDGEVDGRMVEPHVYDGTTPGDPIFDEEVFGPLVGITTFGSIDEAVELANATEYGLTSAVFGGDVARATQVGRRFEAGMVHVNDMTVNDEPNSPFGGEKASGLGRFGGEWILREFTRDRWVTVQHEDREYPV